MTLTQRDGSYYLTDDDGALKATIGDILMVTADERNNALGTLTHETVRDKQAYTDVYKRQSLPRAICCKASLRRCKGGASAKAARRDGASRRLEEKPPYGGRAVLAAAEIGPGFAGLPQPGPFFRSAMCSYMKMTGLRLWLICCLLYTSRGSVRSNPKHRT